MDPVSVESMTTLESMTSKISFGSSNGASNSGVQIGVSNGPVTNHFHIQNEGKKETNDRSRDQSQAHYVIPSLSNRHFTGRESTLDELRQKLFSQPKTEKLALYGLGGIGKTQVALQLARWVKAYVPDCSVFWVPALSIESFEQACSQIAKELQIPQTPDDGSFMELVCRQLSSDKAGKWLFIVDNADDIDLLFDNLDQYFPSGEQGITLLTTRSYDVAISFAGTDVFELQKMTQEEGMAFLAKIVGKDLLSDDESSMKLLQELEFLPLAITQAAYYISRNKGTTTRYLELMHKTEQDRIRLAKRDFHDSTRYRKKPNAVATTWLISFNQIRDSDPLAADLLEFMSYLQPKAIPRSLLPVDSEEDMDFAIGTLCNYGFLTRRDKEGMFDMHSLVQLSTRVWIAEAQKTQQIVTAVTQQIKECFPSEEYKNREIWRMYLPHACEILKKNESKDLRARYMLLSKIGKCIRADGRATEAITFFEDAYAWHKNLYTNEHPDRLSSQYDLARAYRSNRQFKQAIELLESVVEVEKRTLDEEHPDRLASQYNLARAYKSNRQFKQASTLLEYLVEVDKRMLDEEDPDRLACQHELAQVYQCNGQIKQAIKLLEYVVEVEKRTLHEEDSDRLESQHTLARAYRSNGQTTQAIDLLEHVVSIRHRMLDEEHPSQLKSQQELARAYHSNGETKKAIDLLEHVVTVRERTLDEEHPSRLGSQHTLARAYRSNGQIKQAIDLLEHVVRVRERTLDEEDRDRLASKWLLQDIKQSC
ncbi:uncharacterized protein N7483_009697 [Penicillium malachiteum]|uniref:uncharacterized protein n=1 Tax=Penicillium malachiteum TaxID=1324776 RepID=UPI002547618A|nr:uncharacterized protein N7483_009697 [Penicillium malachiteum]KAJ5721763.1 hypothetical protein N7483_009697 [Penicillium malachiteum]